MRLRARALAEVEDGLPGLLGARHPRAGGREEGVYVAELGEETGLDAAAGLSTALRVLEYLRARRDELFGFNMLLACLPAAPGAEQRLRDILAIADRDEELWLAPSCVPLFSPYCSLEEAGGLSRLVALTQRQPAPAEPAARPWVREALVGKVLEALSSRLNSGEGRELLFVHGPPGAGKTAILGEAARRLTGSGGEFPVLRLSTLFRRRSPLHPFLSSISVPLLAEVPRLLRGPEREAWAGTGPLMEFLRAGAGPVLFPDRMVADFTLAYGLYLQAWLRMAAEHLLPGIMICEGVETWLPAARNSAARLIEGFLRCPGFLPVISSSEASVPEEFRGFEIQTVHIHPLGKREIRSFTQHLFPGLEIPEAVARRLRRMSSGLSVTVASYLQYLLRTGRIRADGGRYSWVQSGEDDETILPANPLSVSWFLIRSLHDDAFLMLYAIHLAGGLLDRDGLLAFLQAEGFEEPAVGRSFEGLLASGLMVEGEHLIPRFPPLRRKLEELLGEQGARLRDAFIRHLLALWQQGSYPHQVLLFSFLAKNGRTDLALRVLPAVIRRRIDEGDAAGARAFCDPSRLDFSAALSPAEKKSLAFIATLGTLQAALLEGKLDESARAAAALGREAGRGEALVACATVDLATGDAQSALERLKKALLGFQESGDQVGERSASLALGMTMLADGRTGEAVEYLGLSERLSLEGLDPLAALRAGLALAGCLFIEGRYSRCLAELDAARSRARAVFQREAELFLGFLEARVQFQLGSYDACATLLQACLTHATLYAGETAMPVLEAWLGRSIIYAGDLPRGIACLERIPPGREALLFLAEGLLFSREYDAALQCAERALALPDDGRFPPPTGVGWKDGFWCVEGRCFRLSRQDALLRRTLTGLRAYLRGLTGSPAEGARELHGLTRGVKQVEEDPSAYLLHYLYSLVLLDSAPEQLDDKATVLGKALKALQERSSRIDVPAQRSAFLTRNLWNRRIMDDARTRKLV